MAVSNIQKLEGFLKDRLPHITYATPHSSKYASLREIFLLSNEAAPLAIVRPQNAVDVGKLVKFAIENRIEFTVRSGGHDLAGRSQLQDALTIDIRDIRYVKVSDDRSFATIGAGMSLVDLVAELQKHDLVTPVGNVGSVGYSGWAIYGGYGPYSQKFGLGLDNIIGAKVVTSDGTIVDTAAEPSLLMGIRGAGGAFGVIVELRIKVYPLKKLLGGMIMFESSNIASTVLKYCEGYDKLALEELPDQLSLTPMMGYGPNGKAFFVQVVWIGEDYHDAEGYIAKIKAFGNVVVDTIAPRSPSELLKLTSDPIPTRAYGTTRTVNLKSLGKAAHALGRAAEELPALYGPTIIVHELRGASAKPTDSSVFGARYHHFMTEIVGLALDPNDVEESKSWAETSVDRLRQGGNAYQTTYFSLDMSSGLTLQGLLGDRYPPFKALKSSFDPDNVFNPAFTALLKT